ncbi:sensor histidine kinase, partial [Pantoea agglomerans]|uniref:sensor histidine kinase n=1 Tax=Enterobacter agglomerans TaxID=549 RepID=UPI001ABA8D8D
TQQIWVNLLDNAIKFSHNGSFIHVTLTNNGDRIKFSIQDEGVGMDEETKDRLFDKFYQGDISHSKQGNGLGLSLVKRIVQLCRGDILVESERDEGSLFTVNLPKC